MMFWLLGARQPWEFYVFSTVYGFGYGACVPLFPAAVGDWFGTKFHGSIFGALSAAAALGGTVGPLLAGYAYDTTGGYSSAIVIGGAALFAALVCSALIKVPHANLR
jgi:MFS family permease